MNFMNSPSCEKEPLVLEAVRRGGWDDDLREHAVSCPVCSDAAIAAVFLHELHERDAAEARLPEAGRVWWGAQLLARRAAAERAALPISIVERVAGACAAVSFAALCIWQWNSIRAWLDWFGGLWHVSRYPVEELVVNLWQTSSSMLIIGASAVLIFFTFVAYLVWTEE